jgi:hypothetical protein
MVRGGCRLEKELIENDRARRPLPADVRAALMAFGDNWPFLAKT